MPITASDITDAGTAGIAVIQAETPAQIQAAIGMTSTIQLNMFFHGSSSTGQGSGASFTAINTDGYAEVAAQHLCLPGNVAWRKRGVSGWDFSNYITDRPASVDQYIRVGAINVLVVQGFKNALNSGVSVSQAIADCKTYCSAAKAAGWNKVCIVVPAWPIWAWGTMNTVMPSLVAGLLSDSSFSDGSVADGLIRWDADPAMKNSRVDTDEGVHFNATGWNKAGIAIAKQTSGIARNSGSIQVAITSPSAGSVITADSAVEYTVSGAVGDTVCKLYLAQEIPCSGGKYEVMTLVGTSANGAAFSLPYSVITNKTTKIYVFVEDSIKRSGVAFIASTKGDVSIPAFLASPINTYIANGASGTLSVLARCSTSFSYQWSFSTDAGATWSDCSNGSTYSGVTTKTIGITSATSMEGYLYRCTVSNGNGSSVSESAVLRVTTSPTVYIDDQFASGTFTTGRTPDTAGTNTWTVDSGTATITGGAAVISSMGRVYIDTGVVDKTIEASFKLAAANDWGTIAFRYRDSSNRVKVNLHGDRIEVQTDSGANIIHATYNVSISYGVYHTFKAYIKGTLLGVFIDGDLVASMDVATEYSATKISITPYSSNLEFGYVRAYSHSA